MSRKPIQVVGDEFYSTDPTFQEVFEGIYDQGISTSDARYLDPVTKEIKSYTAQEILDQNAPSGLYISGLQVPTDSQNYARLLTLKKILGTPELLDKVVSTGQITEDVLRQDYDEEAERRYTDELRPYYDKGGVFVDQEYTPRTRRKDEVGTAVFGEPSFLGRLGGVDPQTGKTVEYKIPGEDIGVTGIAPIDAGIDFLYEGNEKQREQYLLRGVRSQNLDTSYLQRRQFSSAEQLDYDSRLARSPTYPTGREFGYVVAPFDPPKPNPFNPRETLPVVSEVVPNDPSSGLVIKSIYNGVDEDTGDYRILPVENIQPVQTALEGDFNPVLDEMSRFVAVEGPGILAGFGLGGLAQKLARKRIKQNVETTEADIELGRVPVPSESRVSDDFFSIATAKDIAYTSVGVAGSEALIKFGALSLGAIPTKDQEGNIIEPAVQPDMTFRRALEESGALFNSALIGGALGDTAIRGFASAWKTATGMPVGSTVMDTLIIEARLLGDKIRGTQAKRPKTKQQDADYDRISEVLEDSEYFDEPLTLAEKIAKQTGDVSVKDQRELGAKTARRLAEVLKNRQQTLGQMSQSDFILALEELLAADLMGGSREFAQLHNFSRDNAIVLDEFYQTLVKEFGADPSTFISKQQVNELFTGARTERLLSELSEEEAAILSAKADANLSSALDSPSREARQAAAADVQEQVSVSQSNLFPDQKSRILVEKQEEVQEARKVLDDVLEGEGYSDPAGNTKMPRFIAGPLEDFLNANKQKGTPFGTTDSAEAEELIREILPYQGEGFNIAAYLGQERVKKVDAQGRPIIDPATGKQAQGLLLPQQAIPLNAQIRMRENINAVISGHPNPVVREKGQALLDAVDEMIDHSLGKVYQARTGADPKDVSIDEIHSVIGADYVSARQMLEETKSEVSGRFLRDIVTKPENEIGSFILTSNPDQVRGLIQNLSRQEDGLQKLQSIRSLVLESLQRQTDNRFAPDASAADQGKAFANLLNKHEEQLRALFPEDFVKFTELPELLNTAREAVKQSKKRIETLNRELEDLSVEGKVPSITDTLDMFFGLPSAQARQLDQTKLQGAVRAIGEIADEYPDLRAALQGYFGEEILVKQLQMTGYDTTEKATRMLTAGGEDKAFNFNNLDRMFLRPYKNDSQLARALEPIVGKDQAFRYAKDLRILARQMRQQKGFAGSPLSDYMKRPEIETAAAVAGSEAGQTALDTTRKLIYGPLDITSTRVGIIGKLIRGGADERKRRYLAKIVQDPEKLRTFMILQDRKLPAITMLKAMQAIAEDRSENYGSEARNDDIKRLREEILEVENNRDIPAVIQGMLNDG
tara:strand:- start:1695 stop:5681 length:3987 start_codon:yes stop_codon:yes gene_type:complete